MPTFYKTLPQSCSALRWKTSHNIGIYFPGLVRSLNYALLMVQEKNILRSEIKGLILWLCLCSVFVIPSADGFPSSFQDNSDGYQRLSLIQELETLIKVGHHSNIVSVVGTCSFEGNLINE